ncbi:MAG: hydantoinase/oxoprolinase family protein [Spirochaetaceae bacterium]|nr:hydantoinase/oxoprolinase family protein [Spirochaetaceae bacterium]
MIRIGIDTGGTFTDLVAFDPGGDRLAFHKVATTPDDPARGIVRGASEIVAQVGARPDQVELLIHGTTVATNAVLQRAGARVALITTAGFRDVLQIQRQDRPRLYDLRGRRARPLVPRALRFELRERVRFDGSVQTPVDRGQLDTIVERLRRERVEAVAVGLLHSCVNAAHEREVGRVLAERLPGAAVCLSHELVGEQGEYERFSTCAMNAFVQPAIGRYLERLEQGLGEHGIGAPLFVMKSSGGVMSARAAGARAVETVMSGPAGGIVAGAAIARMDEDAEEGIVRAEGGGGSAGSRTCGNLITADMGGTSFDVGVVQDGAVAFARDTEMGGLAISVPMLDVHSVGAGGGSIGWIDAGGALRVGPRSAGARPGPACYGTGGSEPTVTDANLVLGRLGAESLLGGGMAVDPDAARRAIHDRLAAPLGMSVEETAEGMIRVVNAAMTAAIRTLTVERGHDPREFALCPFGGAGPLHGAELAAELGIERTVVPLAPGVNSATGLLMTNLREDRVATFVRRLDHTSAAELEQVFAELEATARERLRWSGGGAAGVRMTRALGQRYLGQRYELPVPVAAGRLDPKRVGADFHTEHQRTYGYARTEHPVETHSAWVSVEVDLQPLRLPPAPRAGGRPEPAAVRQGYFAGRRFETPVFHRGALAAGATLTGPAIIEQLDATTALWPGQPLAVDRRGQLLLGPLEHAS